MSHNGTVSEFFALRQLTAQGVRCKFGNAIVLTMYMICVLGLEGRGYFMMPSAILFYSFYNLPVNARK